MLIFFLYLISTLLFSSLAMADIYGFHPHSRLSLGGGFDKFQPNRAFLKCLESDGLESLSHNHTVQSSLEISGVSSVKEFYKKIGFSSFLEGSYLFAKGSASASYDFEESFSKNNLTWLVALKANYGNYALKNPRLKARYVDLPHEVLVSRCGRELVIEEKRSVMLFALLTVKNLSQKKKENLKAKLSFTAKRGSVDAKFSADYKKFMKQAYSLGNISLKVLSHGGLGLDSLKGLLNIRVFMDHNKILDLFKSSLKEVTAESAAPSSFGTTNISTFTKKNISEPVFKKKTLSKIYNTHRQLESSLKVIKNYFHKGYLDEENFIDLAKKTNEKLDRLEFRAQLCFDLSRQRMCRHSGLELYDFSLVTLQNRICERMRRKALNKGLIFTDYYNMAAKRNFYPIFTKVRGEEKILEWNSCELL